MYDAAKAAREFAAKWVGDADAAYSAMCGSYDCPKHEPAYVAVVKDMEAKLRAAHAAGMERAEEILVKRGETHERNSKTHDDVGKAILWERICEDADGARAIAQARKAAGG